MIVCTALPGALLLEPSLKILHGGGQVISILTSQYRSTLCGCFTILTVTYITGWNGSFRIICGNELRWVHIILMQNFCCNRLAILMSPLSERPACSWDGNNENGRSNDDGITLNMLIWAFVNNIIMFIPVYQTLDSNIALVSILLM